MSNDLSAFMHTGEFYAAFCALLWAAAVILFRRGGERVPPVALNLFKDAVGFVLLVATLVALRVPFDPPSAAVEDWLTLLASGAMGIGIADTLFFASLNRLGAGRSAIVDCLYSPFVLLCSFVYLKEPVGPSLLFAIVMMAAAILVGTWQGGVGGTAARGRRTRVGVVLGAASMLIMAAGIVLAKPVLDRSDVLWATTVRMTGGLAVLGVQCLSPLRRAQVASAFRPGPHWRFTLPGSVVGAYLSIVFWTLGMKYTQTTVASVLNQLSTVFVMLLAAAVLHERLGWRQVVAIVFGIAGALVVTV